MDDAPAFTCRDDAHGRPAVFYHGVYHTAETCAGVLAEFRRIAETSDWFAPMAARRVEELTAAMRQAGGAYAEQIR